MKIRPIVFHLKKTTHVDLTEVRVLSAQEVRPYIYGFQKNESSGVLRWGQGAQPPPPKKKNLAQPPPPPPNFWTQ